MSQNMPMVIPANAVPFAADVEPDIFEAEYTELDLDADGLEAIRVEEATFSSKPGGIYYLERRRREDVFVRICSPIEVIAQTKNADGQNCGYLLEFPDAEGVLHRKAIPARLMAGGGGSYCSELMDQGLRVYGRKGREFLGQYLNNTKVDVFALSVDRIGWHGDSFVLLDEVFGEQNGQLIVPQGMPTENSFLQKGNLEEWQAHVGRFCIGNSRLMLAVSAALAGPLLEPLTEESGGLHLVGSSSIGKTTALCVGGSVCGGGPSGLIKQWRATDNALEGIAAAHCDALLCLDEMGQAEPRVVSKAVYMLANGQGKGRAKGDGQNRKTPAWRSLFLSTGEITLAEKIAEEGRGHAKAGQSVRVVDIPADAGAGLGLFENLHGSESADQFSRQLKSASSDYYGTPLRAFLRKFVADRGNLTQLARGFMNAFMTTNCPDGTDGQVSRVCGRFALVAAAGELGIMLGVLPWTEGEASQAATTCFQAWLGQRGGYGKAELMAGVEQVRAFFRTSGATRFQETGLKGPQLAISNLAGFRHRRKSEDVFWVKPDVFRQEVCAGLDVNMVCGELKRMGILLPGSASNTQNVRSPAGRQCKMFVLTAAILSGNIGSAGNTPGNTGEITLQAATPPPVAAVANSA